MKPDWTAMSGKEKAAAVEPLMRAGKSFGRIAAMFSGASRNAVIGFARRSLMHVPRSGLKTDVGPSRVKRKPRGPAKPARHGDTIRAGWVAHKAKAVSVPLRPRPKAIAVGPLPQTGTVAYLAWRSGQCHFPMWGNDDFNPFTSMFCGRTVEGESPYCGPHKHLCRQPLNSSRIARDTREVEAAA